MAKIEENENLTSESYQKISQILQTTVIQFLSLEYKACPNGEYERMINGIAKLIHSNCSNQPKEYCYDLIVKISQTKFDNITHDLIFAVFEPETF